MYIPGTTYLHILLHCTLYLIAHLTPYFISLFVSYFILTIFVYIYTLSCFCFIVFIAYVIFILLLCFIFFFLHFPLSGPVLTNISLPIIPCMIVYVTNNKEPWTLNLKEMMGVGYLKNNTFILKYNNIYIYIYIYWYILRQKTVTNISPGITADIQ